MAALNELNNSDYVHVWDYQEHKAATRGHPIIGVSFKALFFKDKEHKTAYLNRLPLIENIGNDGNN